MNSEDDVIGSRRVKPPADQLNDLPMWSGTGPLLVKSVTREARSRARAKVERHLVGQRGIIYQALLDHGPMDRAKIHEVTGIAENSVNGRVAELVVLKKARIVKLDRTKDRGVVEAIR